MAAPSNAVKPVGGRPPHRRDATGAAGNGSSAGNGASVPAAAVALHAADRGPPPRAIRGPDGGCRPCSPGGPGLASDVTVPPTHEEGEMPVGEIFLYAIWAAIAIGSMIVTAMVLRGGD
jgi:hypothetical protein